MKLNLVFDLDGVIRNLHHHIEKLNNSIVDKWDWKNKQGKGIIEIVEDNLEILLDSPPTEYAKDIKEYFNTNYSEIWTAQAPHWQPYTQRWIERYFYPKTPVVKYYTPNEKYQSLYKTHSIIVEDSPKFKTYDRIILIDRLYNKHIVNPFVRVENKNNLSMALTTFSILKKINI